MPHDAVQRPCLVVWLEFETTTSYSIGALLITLTRQLCGLWLWWESLNQVVMAVVGQHSPVKDSRLRQTADVNLYHVTKFSPYFPFALYCLYTKISSFIPVLTIGIVRDCFYLLISYSEKFST